jgi:hypothetical protein
MAFVTELVDLELITFDADPHVLLVGEDIF